MGTAPKGSKEGKKERNSHVAKKVAERLVAVKNETAMLTTFNEADMAPIFALKKIQESFNKSMRLA